jgi:hypothetical protein
MNGQTPSFTNISLSNIAALAANGEIKLALKALKILKLQQTKAQKATTP